jgi:hypothetical protein
MEELAALGEFEEALTLAELLPSETDRTRLTQVCDPPASASPTSP